MKYSEMYDAAVDYIKRGLAVFPLSPRGKKPLTPHGFQDATTDPAKVKAWWQKWPKANIGIATGQKSHGVFVIDMDMDEEKGTDGYHALEEWERENGELPDTWLSITGTGGYHMFFKSDQHVGNRVRIIDYVDVRGDGGYIVAPPSIHPNGRQYQWEIAPEDMKIATANDIVNKFLNTRTPSEKFKLPEIIPDGSRNECLFKFACSLQSQGLSDSAILAAVTEENKIRCAEPLDDDEITKIVNSVLKYDKGKLISFDTSGNALPQGWRSPNLNYNDDGSIKQTATNASEAIQYDKELYGKIKQNELAWAPFVCGELPWEHENMYREWNNFDDSNLIVYLEKTYGLKNKEKIMDGLNVVINQNRFNPVVEMLEDIHDNRWDGKTGHIENLLPDYLGVEKDEYSTACMQIFMLGAISRAYFPGCKFDLMPVVTGKQGIGKSTFFRYLSMNNNWFNDNFNTVEGDKAPEKIRGMWMVEMAELLAAKKAKEVESIKAFLTSTEDVFRPAYARRSERHPRMCVFVGTTNSSHFLTDRTGNRRYLPLQAREEAITKSLFEDPAQVQRDFENAWGEAMDIFLKADKHPRLTLSKEVAEIALKKQSEYTEEDARIGIIQEWLDHTSEHRVCVAMLYKEALDNGDKKPSRFESSEILAIMDNCIEGWMRLPNSGGRARCGSYGTQICYERNGSFIPPRDDLDGFMPGDEDDLTIFD